MLSFLKKKEPKAADVESVKTAYAAAVSGEPKTSELDGDDILAEADVYWTYGKWWDAIDLYKWWINANGTGDDNKVALRYFECCVKASAEEPLIKMARQLMADDSANHMAEFLKNVAIMGLMYNPSSFELIKLANDVNVEADKIESIAVKVVKTRETPAEKKQKLWQNTKKQAQNITSQQNSSEFLENLPLILNGDTLSSKDLDSITYNGAYTLLGPEVLDDSAYQSNDLLHLVLAGMSRVIESNSKNLGLLVDTLFITHNEGLRSDYTLLLLRLFTILNIYNAGKSLKRRLLAMGKLLGYNPVFDQMNTDLEGLLSLQNEYDSGFYLDEKELQKSSEWNSWLFTEVNDSLVVEVD